MTKVEFRPTLKEVKTQNGKTRLVLEIDKQLLIGRLEVLSMLEGGKITASFRPETIPFTIPYDRSTNAPAVRYDENEDGLWQAYKEEQTNLLDDNTIENREFMVEVDVVDEFIKTAQLDYPEGIDPADILERLEQGESYPDIAVEYEMTGDDLEDALNAARDYYAAYASAWDKKRNEGKSND